MGEQSDSVLNVGAPGLEALDRIELLDRAGLERRLGAVLPAPLLLVTFHPETRGGDHAAAAADIVVRAALNVPDTHLLVTRANADAGGRAINGRLSAYAVAQADRVTLVASLGQQGYPSALTVADAVIGNSSSGMIEAPAVGTPTVNIGGRQDGRLRAPSVLDCPLEEAARSRKRSGVRWVPRCRPAPPGARTPMARRGRSGAELPMRWQARPRYPAGASRSTTWTYRNPCPLSHPKPMNSEPRPPSL